MSQCQSAGMQGMSPDRQPGFDVRECGLLFFIGVTGAGLGAQWMKPSMGHVKLIANQRIPQMGKVHSNLMITACQRSRTNQSVFREAFQHLKVGR